ncbi:MAG: hypothetical protein GY937_02045 [bacterium]|nr:hypothetical protein [bacterium]
MSGRSVIAFDQKRRSRRLFPEESIVAMFVFLIFDAMIVAGTVGGFVLTRAAAGDTWPPAGQPWFLPEDLAINTAVLLMSGALVFLAARSWENQKSRIGPLLLAAIASGTFFVVFQGVLWISLIRQGLTLSSSQHGYLFCVIVATHVAHAVGALILLSVIWLRLKPLRDDAPDQRQSSSSSFRVVRLLWYYTVGVWPVLCLCLYR